MELMHCTFDVTQHRKKVLASNAHLVLASVGAAILCGLVLGNAELAAQSAAGTRMSDSIGLVLANLLAVHLN